MGWAGLDCFVKVKKCERIAKGMEERLDICRAIFASSASSSPPSFRSFHGFDNIYLYIYIPKPTNQTNQPNQPTKPTNALAAFIVSKPNSGLSIVVVVWWLICMLIIQAEEGRRQWESFH